jgi:hypothetical protein
VKARVAAAARAAGCTFEVDAREVWLCAPEGFCFGTGETYSSWPVGGRDAYCTKAQAYREALDLLASGVVRIEEDRS